MRGVLNDFPTRRSSDLLQALTPERRSGVRSSLGRASMHAAARLDTLGTEQAYVVLVSSRAAACMDALPRDRKSTRLNSNHSQNSYAVLCLKKKMFYPAV